MKTQDEVGDLYPRSIALAQLPYKKLMDPCHRGISMNASTVFAKVCVRVPLSNSRRIVYMVHPVVAQLDGIDALLGFSDAPTDAHAARVPADGRAAGTVDGGAGEGSIDLDFPDMELRTDTIAQRPAAAVPGATAAGEGDFGLDVATALQDDLSAATAAADADAAARTARVTAAEAISAAAVAAEAPKVDADTAAAAARARAQALAAAVPFDFDVGMSDDDNDAVDKAVSGGLPFSASSGAPGMEESAEADDFGLGEKEILAAPAAKPIATAAGKDDPDLPPCAPGMFAADAPEGLQAGTIMESLMKAARISDKDAG